MSQHDFLSSSMARELLAGQDWCPFMPVFGPPAVMFARGEGTELWDVNGKRYLDFLCGIAVTSLGHSNKAVSRALSHQAETLLHVSNFFSNPVATEAAMLINGLMRSAGVGDGQVFFCNSGAEANEAAIKLARKFGGRGRHVVVSALGSFHGRTLGALAATGQPAKHEPFQPMPEGFRHVPYGDVDALIASLDPSVAAVLLEPIQGEGGVIPAPDGYLQSVANVCRERGLLFMVDEVQTGFARTGRWFGFEHAGVRPDVVMFAKALGNGVPVGALWARRDVASVFSPGDHGSTYSGTAIATAAVVAVINEMTAIDAPARAREAEKWIRSELVDCEHITHIRGQGLLLGLVLSPGIDAKVVYAELLEAGLVANAVNADTIRLAPPLTVTHAEVVEACSILRDTLATVATSVTKRTSS
jgi:predicted acetylornithine/succinylornithine family transaminase